MMIYLKSALAPALALLAAVPAQAAFETSPIHDSMNVISMEELAKLDFDVPQNGKNLKVEVSEKTFARSGGVELSILDVFKYVPYVSNVKEKCSSQEFGYVGAFTTCVCSTYDQLEVICGLEPGCDSSLIQGIKAGKATMLENYDYLSWAFCAVANGADDSSCQVGNLPESDAYELAARGVDFIVNMSEEGFHNALFTAGMDLTGSFAPSNVNKVIGDGVLDLKSRSYERLHGGSPYIPFLVEYDVRLTVTDALLYQYSGAFDDADEDEFYVDSLRGVLAKKYKDRLFPEQPTKVVDVGELKYDTHCALALGISAARKCGYGLEDMHDLINWYFENRVKPNAPNEHSYWCHRFKSHKYTQTKHYMNIDTISETKAASPEACVTLLNI